MIFAPLPSAFPKLESRVRSMDQVVVIKPPPVDAIGRRLRSAYARARPDGYRSVTSGELRKLPYAYWLPPEAPLHETDAPLVQRYWSEALPEAMDSGPRRGKRWLGPLFFTYCEAFDPADEWFHEFAQRLLTTISRSQGGLGDRLKDLHQDVGFFNPAWVPTRLAQALLRQPGRFEDVLQSFLLWPRSVDTPLGVAVFDAALRLGEAELSQAVVVFRVIDWARRLGAPVSKTSHRVTFADALLRPWLRRKVPDAVKSALVEFFVRVYGDPRMEGTRQYQWAGVSPEAISVLMTWLAGDTLRGFMRVLERTADDIWRHRQKFWMAYYNAGHIQEAWLALGTKAAWFAKKLQADDHGLGYGHMESGATSDQSVLLLKIGHLVFTEWSHNGSLRAYRDDSEEAPLLYRQSYHGYDLRSAASMDFHAGLNRNPELRHINSAGGSWQRKARDFIRLHTGLHLDDREIL